MRFQPVAKYSLDEFWDYVDQSDVEGCWPWMGVVAPTGYGHFGKCGPAHRIAYSLTKGPIPRGKVIRHSCDNRPCCNPTHLLLGTALDNLNDARERGRWRPNERKTHCRKGHEFTPENTYERVYEKRGHRYSHRYCLKCRSERVR